MITCHFHQQHPPLKAVYSALFEIIINNKKGERGEVWSGAGIGRVSPALRPGGSGLAARTMPQRCPAAGHANSPPSAPRPTPLGFFHPTKVAGPSHFLLLVSKREGDKKKHPSLPQLQRLRCLMYASELSLNRSQPANLEMTQPCLTSLAPRILAQSRRSPQQGRLGLHPRGRAHHCTERTGGVIGANRSSALKTPRRGKMQHAPPPANHKHDHLSADAGNPEQHTDAQSAGGTQQWELREDGTPWKVGICNERCCPVKAEPPRKQPKFAQPLNIAHPGKQLLHPVQRLDVWGDQNCMQYSRSCLEFYKVLVIRYF
ncbi:uncharacterized protein LOC132378244 [Hypanus sabinus]|uniref:uncharacterized protein LOC132378244 n=1 Tax=Hypanus sabinus TaxID=79690 RepID=UPI0028C42F28|nr:uncharacterized protein LOC132378244 [Hypanus sabinus]